MLITELERGRGEPGVTAAGPRSHKIERERDREIVHQDSRVAFYELDLSGSLKCLEFLDPVDMDIVLAILQLLIAACSLRLAEAANH